MPEKLPDLPSWKEHRGMMFSDEDIDAGDAWKNKATTEACEAAYEQWRQVVYLLNGVLQDPDEDEAAAKNPARSLARMAANRIFEDAMVVGVKLLSSEVLHYVGRMENAAIIRKAAQDVALALWSLQIRDDRFQPSPDGLAEDHRKVLRAEIDKFRGLFKDWIGTFRRDEYEDEWGLFL